MRILVTNKIDDDEAKDLSWRSDVALGIDCYKHNLYFESFLFDEENKVAKSTPKKRQKRQRLASP
ncbi:BnaC04g01140D [Brassica napus]|uniref:(rape) hypothetical protein n=2 Tax=Brassica napus TaxID=3708 RepID=A0A078HWE9_BRANA|nr:unnamed protein product [Brassica napus]CDY42036.1 BnaC04g01140D [Brassica napus]